MGERELLGIVEGIKAFEGILRGQDLTIHMDHLNLLYDKNPTQRMIRWQLMLEEYHPKVLHVAGKENDAADVLSRLDMGRVPVLGGSILVIASTFLVWGLIPLLVNRNPKYSTSFCVKKHFLRLALNPLVCNLLRTISTFARWSASDSPTL